MHGRKKFVLLFVQCFVALGTPYGCKRIHMIKDRLESMTLGGFSYNSEEGKCGATGSLFRHDFSIAKTTEKASWKLTLAFALFTTV